MGTLLEAIALWLYLLPGEKSEKPDDQEKGDACNSSAELSKFWIAFSERHGYQWRTHHQRQHLMHFALVPCFGDDA